MVEHYFSEKPKGSFRKEEFIITIGTEQFTIHSGSGVFSLKELDFGTKLLIEHMQIPKHAASANSSHSSIDVLDLGCGYGIVGMYVKRTQPHTTVTLCDINERAVKLAQKNCAENRIEATVFQSDIFSHPELQHRQFDAILTNPPFSAGKKVSIDMIKQSFSHLKKGGLFQLVAPHNKGGESLKKIMLETFGNSGEIAKKSGYRVYISVKK